MTEFVWYSPELDDWRVDTKEAGFVFEDEFGPFHTVYYTSPDRAFAHSKYYLMGPL